MNEGLASNSLNIHIFSFSKISHEKSVKMLDKATFTWTAAMENKRCPITMTDFKSGDQVVRLACRHLFSSDAIKQWFSQSRTCPSCRRNLAPSPYQMKMVHQTKCQMNN